MSAQDTINTLDKKLEQVKSIIGCLCSNDHFTELSSQTISGNLWAVADLTEDLQHLSEDLWEQINPEAPAKSQDTVTFDTGGIDVTVNFRKETLLVLEEMVKYIDHASCVGQGLLDAVERQDKPAANEKPEEAS